VDEMQALLETVGTTEASRLPVEAALGQIGETEIREGARTVTMTPASTVTFYFDVSSVVSASGIASKVAGTTAFDEAHEILRGEGFTTEIEVEGRRV
ncbi:MAG: DUF1152 domain-containing protein, partial [Halobacteria archaeon]|nr:DUF1152 domain-containing protein [Halobacteria archaeon]